MHQEAEVAPHLELVISGLVRVHVSAADGRTMTIRYCRRGALLGVATLYAPVSRPFAIQALSDVELLADGRRYDPNNVFRLNQNIPPR